MAAIGFFRGNELERRKRIEVLYRGGMTEVPAIVAVTGYKKDQVRNNVIIYVLVRDFSSFP